MFEADREELERKTRVVFEYAQKIVAHRTPIDNLSIKANDIHEALDALEPVLQKYYAILIGPSLVSATAAIQWNWMDVFTFAWAPAKTD